MPVCKCCGEVKGFNKFHGPERKKANPVCKQCIREGKVDVNVDENVNSTCSALDRKCSNVSHESESPSERKIMLKDFDLLCTIGKGAYGKVVQVRHKASKKIYAMKIISKKFLIEKDNVQYIRSERDIMTKIDSPFIVSLRYAFQTECMVFLVMDYQPGGELFSHMRDQGLFYEETAKFYIAEMILALEHLHSMDIIHRDLKPENVLLSKNGHIRLTDFGVAKELEGGEESHTLCGTQEYMAPEMILGTGYGSAVDWWSLGALSYEMLTGKPPFQSKNSKLLYKKILTSKIHLPSWLSKEAHSLLKSLLERNVDKRIGSGKSDMFTIRGVQALKKHPFFSDIDWKRLEKEDIKPPIIPNVDDVNGTNNFDPKIRNVPVWDKNLRDDSANDIEEHHIRSFRGFSFCDPEYASTMLRRISTSSFSSSTVKEDHEIEVHTNDEAPGNHIEQVELEDSSGLDSELPENWEEINTTEAMTNLLRCQTGL